ncbi:MAG: SGNH/GDSL hydrolase family protein [bacterium]|nr:SGNH/GDSL hydrolase family protein [bacterium]
MIKRKKRVSAYIKSFLLAVLMLLLAEQYSYFNYIEIRGAQFVEDPVLFWKLTRYCVMEQSCQNKFGQRYHSDPYEICNSYIMREKDEEVSHPSVMMLGDSCTYGAGVEQSKTIPANLEKILQKDFGVPFRVYNAGCPGYSSQQSFYLFKHLAPVYKPDIIIVANFYGDFGSDFIKDSDRLPPEPLLTAKVLLWKSCAYRTLRGWFQNQFSSSRDKPMNIWRVLPGEYYANVKKIKELGKNYNSCLTIITYYPCNGDNKEDKVYLPYMIMLQDDHTKFVNLRKLWNTKNKVKPELFLDCIHFSDKGCELVAEDLAEAIEGREEFKELCQRYKR